MLTRGYFAAENCVCPVKIGGACSDRDLFFCRLGGMALALAEIGIAGVCVCRMFAGGLLGRLGRRKTRHFCKFIVFLKT